MSGCASQWLFARGTADAAFPILPWQSAPSCLGSLLPCLQLGASTLSPPSPPLTSRQLADPESHSHAEKARYLGLTLLLALMLGSIQLAAGLLRMGWVVRFLSHAVVSGFSSGAAIILGGWVGGRVVNHW